MREITVTPSSESYTQVLSLLMQMDDTAGRWQSQLKKNLITLDYQY